jgi:hypothetical protein
MDKRFYVINNKRNRGVMRNIRKCLKIGNGQLVLPIASDDFLSNELFFEKAISVIKENPDISGFFAKTEIRSSDLKKRLWEMGHANKDGYITNQEAVEWFFSNKLWVPGSSALWRKKFFDEAGGFDLKLGAQCDYYINHILPMRHGVYFWNATSTVMRKSDHSFSSLVNNKQFFSNHALFEKKARAYLLNPKPTQIQWLRWRVSIINARLDIELNLFLFSKLEEAFKRIHEWEKSALAPYLTKIVQIFHRNGKSFNQSIKAQEVKAHAIFNKIAGQIETVSFHATPLSGASFVAKALKKTRSYFKKLLYAFTN